MAKLAVLISGNGGNLQAMIDEGLPIDLVLSNRSEAFGLERAQKAGIANEVYLKGEDRLAYDLGLAERLADFDLIVLAGWMHILSAEFLSRVKAEVINLHPALPGQFPGTHAIERAHNAFKKGEIEETGCMVHRVIAEVDAGEVLAQARVPIYADDTLESLSERMHQTEHRLLPPTVRSLLGTLVR